MINGTASAALVKGRRQCKKGKKEEEEKGRKERRKEGRKEAKKEG